MATVTMTVCDKCGAEATRTWNLHGPERTYLAELCEEHSKEMKEALKSFVPGITEPRESKKGVLTADFKNRMRLIGDVS